MNILFGILILLLLGSGLFSVIAWKFNFIALGVLVVVWFVAKYNSFVSLRTNAQEAWSDIDVQLKRRYDLIPNLVSTVKGYATHESSAFEAVTEARAKAMNAQGLSAHASAEETLGKAVTGLFGIAEAYPDLKANTNFLSLQNELSDTENKIQASRRFYNGTVRDLNANLAMFPNTIIASLFHFEKMDFFEVTDTATKEPVEVKF